MELQQLLSIETVVQQMTRQAFSQLSKGEVSNAADTLSKTLSLQYDPFIAVVFDFCNSILQKTIADESGVTSKPIPSVPTGE